MQCTLTPATDLLQGLRHSRPPGRQSYSLSTSSMVEVIVACSDASSARCDATTDDDDAHPIGEVDSAMRSGGSMSGGMLSAPMKQHAQNCHTCSTDSPHDQHSPLHFPSYTASLSF